MKLIISLLIGLTLLYIHTSCNQRVDGVSPIPIGGQVGVITEKEAIIDTSDLHMLPKDIGGLQQAFPIGSTKFFYGYYAYTPSGYKEEGQGYPLIVFLHGSGERGDSGQDPENLKKLLANGPPSLIHVGRWKPSFPFVVVSPQISSGSWNAFDTHRFIEHILENYNINEKRIYLTGLSLGAWGCWVYGGTLEDNYAAAMVPISGSAHPGLAPLLSKIPIWAFHGENDELVDPYEGFGSVSLVQEINKFNPRVKAKVCLFNHLGHDAWTVTYNNLFRVAQFHHFDMNIYDWMLQYKKE